MGQKKAKGPVHPKTSDQFKSMMGAPKAECEADWEVLKRIVGDPNADDSQEVEFLGVVDLPEDGFCISQTGKGKKVDRCKFKRVAGHAYCV